MNINKEFPPLIDSFLREPSDFSICSSTAGSPGGIFDLTWHGRPNQPRPCSGSSVDHGAVAQQRPGKNVQNWSIYPDSMGISIFGNGIQWL